MGPPADFASAGVFRLANRNNAAAIEGTNQNEAVGVNFAAVVDSALTNYGVGN